MDSKNVRRPFKIGTAQALTLPARWRKRYGPIDNVIVYEDHGLLIVAPVALESMAEALMDAREVENQKLIQEV